MDVKKTQGYYEKLSYDELCSCAYCQNYIRQVKYEYPEIAEYLQKFGVDIEKPFEAMPLEPDEDGYIESLGFEKAAVNSVNIDIADSHPAARIKEEYFVIEIYPIRLKWVMPPISG